MSLEKASSLVINYGFICSHKTFFTFSISMALAGERSSQLPGTFLYLF